MQRFVTQLVGPRRMPKLELAGGVPEEARSLVAIPMLLTDDAEIREAVQRLEVHYLANPDSQLRFALLSDWPDAASESMPDDQALLGAARAAIRELNDRHGSAAGGGGRFWVFHRRRLWNEREEPGWGGSANRGKLRELNRLLRGATERPFFPSRTALRLSRHSLRHHARCRHSPREAVRRMVGTFPIP